MIQGYVKLRDKDQRKVIVRTEYDDLIVLRILDGANIDVGDAIVGALDCQGENFILDLNKQLGVRVYVENGHRLFASAGRHTEDRHSIQSGRSVRRLEA
ncbi:hypothetical protein EHM92_02820 [bacterium]|nr:MAG: hypothetical protein EHM92_02820 [bacterium]